MESVTVTRIGKKGASCAPCWCAKRPIALGIPRQSPIQVLTQPNAA